MKLKDQRAPDEAVLPAIFGRLLDAYGPQHWWPGDSPTEVAVGAILTQNTAWTNVERAIKRMRQGGWLDWRRIDAAEAETLAEVIRPAGTFRVKAARLKALAHVVAARHGGSIERMLTRQTEGSVPRTIDEIRAELLAIHGIGPETADAIMLYAGGHATFVIDTYTRRVLRRHFLAGANEAYDALRALFMRSLPPDERVFNEYHALLVRVGKEHCGSVARCDGCPLAALPHDEPALDGNAE
ncbi:MAG: Endonuclease III [Phycisphaerae bacterium]|nr:Endonuclease III [Phycisphaerae bacterium]